MHRDGRCKVKRTNRLNLSTFGALVLTLVGLGCAGTRPVTVAGDPSTDPFTVEMANRLYNLETGAVLAGEVLLAAHGAGQISNDGWSRIMEVSSEVRWALEAARRSLLEYEALPSNRRATDAGRAFAVLEAAARVMLEMAEEESR